MLQPISFFKTILFWLATFFCVSALANPIIPIPTQPQPTIVTPSAPTIDAEGYVLMDANTGKIIAEKNSDAHVAPASLTKLMTMYVISNAIKNGSIHLDDKVQISEKAWKTGGSRMFVKVGDAVSVRDLLQGIVVASGNDATVAMAEYIAGTEDAFATLMNAQAKALGMNNSHFVDSNGLPNPEHYSSPRDLALLTQAIIKNFPEDYKLYSEKWFTYNHIRQPNRNRLLWRFPYADGLKTGHTQDAGYCLVGSALKNGTRLISVVVGAPSDSARTEDSIRLLTYGFHFFETHRFYSANTELTQSYVFRGKNKNISLGLANDLYVTLPAGQYKNVRTEIKVQEPLKAPIFKGQTYGTLNIILNNQVLATQPMVALMDDPKGGMLRGLADSIRFSVNKFFSKSTERANNG